MTCTEYCPSCGAYIGQPHSSKCELVKKADEVFLTNFRTNGCSILPGTEAKIPAWSKYSEVLRQNSFTWEPRSDLRVEALGCDRAVRISIGKYTDRPNIYGPGMQIDWTNTSPRNVGTMREFAQAILHACDFVDEVNPRWAQGHQS